MFLTADSDIIRTVTRGATVAIALTEWMIEGTLDVDELDLVVLGANVAVARPRSWHSPSVLDIAMELPEPEVDPMDLHRLIPDPPAWHALALCSTPDHEQVRRSDAWFFGVDDEERPALPPTMVDKARNEYCNDCPVRAACLQWALENDERFGIWGGTTGRQREQMRTALRAGRVELEELLAIYV